jgi:hypothetical protein
MLLDQPQSWATLPTRGQLSGGVYRMNITVTGRTQFYRLRCNP